MVLQVFYEFRPGSSFFYVVRLQLQILRFESNQANQRWSLATIRQNLFTFDARVCVKWSLVIKIGESMAHECRKIGIVSTQLSRICEAMGVQFKGEDQFGDLSLDSLRFSATFVTNKMAMHVS